MSLIATFHLVPEGRLPELLEAARPVKRQVEEKRLLVSRTRTVEEIPLWDWLDANARELEDLPLSGMALVALELVAAEDGARVLHGLEAPEAALGERIGSTFAVYDAAAAGRALARLASLDLSPEPVRRALEAEYGKTSADEVEAVADARDWLRGALAEVAPGDLGLLNVG